MTNKMKSGISVQWHHPSTPQLLIFRLGINRINEDGSLLPTRNIFAYIILEQSTETWPLRGQRKFGRFVAFNYVTPS